MSIGIYMLRNEIDGKIYIGQSTNLEKRNKQHKNALLNNRHFNEHLQKAYNKYGNVFKFIIIELCSEEELDDKELYWINKFNSLNKKYGYNILSGGKQFKCHSQESKNKIRNANQGSNNKLTLKDVINIKRSLVTDYNTVKLAEQYNVTKATISKIGTCKNWVWVESELNNELINRKDILKSKVISEWKNNKSASQISKENSIGMKQICNILSDEIKNKELKIKERNLEIIKDYKNGMSKTDIINKYNISKTTFVRITSNIYNKKRNDLIAKVVEMKKQGISTKEIANKFNINSSTVNRYFKAANTEVIQ